MINDRWRTLCSCALGNDVPRQSFYVALVVGTVLNLINQGDAIFGAAAINWVKLVLTYAVPYLVCTYGAVSAQLKQISRERTGATAWPS